MRSLPLLMTRSSGCNINIMRDGRGRYNPDGKRLNKLWWGSDSRIRIPPIFMEVAAGSTPESVAFQSMDSPLSVIASDSEAGTVFQQPSKEVQDLEENIEKVIYHFRFLTLLGVFGSLVGSFLCFIKGCTYVMSSFMEYSMSGGKVILLLVEAIDVYLLGTVMMIFGMGLYELFVSTLDIAKSYQSFTMETSAYRSSLFGLFMLMERPKWLEIKSINELKTKLGHVIVMILLVGMYEKSIKVVIYSPIDLLCFSASILLSSGCLYLLSKLKSS
eukprot:TRINITY_DN4735_c0_g1_i1.p1 TRINITY_DN4735_c0_g1~~TRINITY_DN4735_c0_g1_i1.p1  ORF type:complete len:273 (+),score=34.88 TRINITY_DN4735_c0_g1_i1:219-1037(+)